MGLIERLPQQPHHIRLKTHDKESRTGILRPLEWGWVDTSGNISTGSDFGKFPFDPFHHQLPPLSPSIKRASGVQVPSNKRAITVQYPGPFGVKSPPVGFKPS